VEWVLNEKNKETYIYYRWFAFDPSLPLYWLWRHLCDLLKAHFSCQRSQPKHCSERLSTRRQQLCSVLHFDTALSEIAVQITTAHSLHHSIIPFLGFFKPQEPVSFAYAIHWKQLTFLV
jgi:hypothetical protein